MVSIMWRVIFNFCHQKSNGAACYRKPGSRYKLHNARIQEVGLSDGHAVIAKSSDQSQKVAFV